MAELSNDKKHKYGESSSTEPKTLWSHALLWCPWLVGTMDVLSFPSDFLAQPERAQGPAWEKGTWLSQVQPTFWMYLAGVRINKNQRGRRELSSILPWKGLHTENFQASLFSNQSSADIFLKNAFVSSLWRPVKWAGTERLIAALRKHPRPDYHAMEFFTVPTTSEEHSRFGWHQSFPWD